MHQWKYLLEQQSHSDDEINDSMSDCDVSGKEISPLYFLENINRFL